MRALLVCLALVMLAACDYSSADTSDSLELIIDRTQFTAGDEIVVVLDNDGAYDRTYSPCPKIYRASGPRTTAVVDDGVTCSDILNVISPGQSVIFRVDVPEDLETETYFVGLITSLETPVGFTRQTLFSQSFDVASAG